MKKILAILFFFMSFLINFANAELGGGMTRLTNTAPIGSIFPNENPIVFPDFAMAAGINASAIPNERAFGGQIGGSPALQATDATGFFAGLTKSNSTSGFNIGYVGSMSPAGSLTNQAFAGFGYKIKTVSLGLGIRNLNVTGNGAYNIDLSTTVAIGNLRIAAILYHVDWATQIGIGLGMKSGKTFTAEINVITPSLNNLAGNYTLTAAANMHFGPAGFFLRTSYFTYWSNYSFTVGGQFWIGDHVNLVAQYSSPRVATFGLTFSF